MLRDPRLNELAEIGLPAVWLDIAELTGFDTFLEIWRMLSKNKGCQHDGGARLPKLRYYPAYLRYQRNRYIAALVSKGLPAIAIQSAVQKNLYETLDITSIQRIAHRRASNAA